MQKSNLPKHLSELQACGFRSGEPIAQFEIGDFENFVYLILDSATRKASVVDPQKDLSLLDEVLSGQGYQLESIILTHTHFDHVAGVSPLLQRMPELPVWVGEADVHRLPTKVTRNLKMLSDGEHFRVGSLEIQAMLTPGHSAGAVSYFLKKQSGISDAYLFTGDTVFIRDCGRTDLETGSNEEMFQSIQKIKKLPPETILLVGHHYADECATRLEDELKYSPPFQVQSVEELARLP